MMYLKNILENDTEIDYTKYDGYLETIKKRCSKFIKECNSVIEYPLYRGLQNSYHEIVMKLIRKDRKTAFLSTNTWGLFFQGVDTAMKKRFDVCRTNSIQATGADYVASDYGNVYQIFLIGDYKYLWSPEIKDYYYTAEKDLIKNPGFEDGIAFIEKYGNTYINKNLIKAIESGNEILISGEHYYGIRVHSVLHDYFLRKFEKVNAT